MIESIVLGIIQGVAEWLPVSSEGLLVLTKVHFFPSPDSLTEIIRQVLFLHLGTFLAALVYFRREVKTIVQALFQRPKNSKDQKLALFIIITSLISGSLGFLLLKTLAKIESQLALTGKAVTLAIGLLLLVTAFLQLKAKKQEGKQLKNPNLTDGVILGLVQALTALPGFSRSGLTVSALLLRRFEKTQALKLSFLLSLPIVLGGNIILNYQYFSFNPAAFVGLAFSFVFGLLTIDLLLKIAQRINFGYFVFAFGLLTIASVFV